MAKYMSFCKNCKGWLLTDSDECPKCGQDLIESDISANEWKRFSMEDKQEVTEEFLSIKMKPSNKKNNKNSKNINSISADRSPVQESHSYDRTEMEAESSGSWITIVGIIVGAFVILGGLIGSILLFTNFVTAFIGIAVIGLVLSIGVGIALILIAMVAAKQNDIMERLNRKMESNVQSQAQPVVQPMMQPQAQPVVQPKPQPMVQPVAQPMVQPQEQPVVQPKPQPMMQPAEQPKQLSIDELVEKRQDMSNSTTMDMEAQKTEPFAQPAMEEKKVEPPVVKQVPRVEVYGEMLEYSDEIVANCNSLSSATEILQYLEYLTQDHNDGGLDELIKFVGKYASAEATRGNLKPQVVKIVAASFNVVL